MRYTPKYSIESLRQQWLAVNPDNPKLNDVGQTLARAARNPKQFKQLMRELLPESFVKAQVDG